MSKAVPSLSSPEHQLKFYTEGPDSGPPATRRACPSDYWVQFPARITQLAPRFRNAYAAGSNLIPQPNNILLLSSRLLVGRKQGTDDVGMLDALLKGTAKVVLWAGRS